MTIETLRQRVRRRFAFGALEQLANIFGGITASVLTVGLFLPALQAFSGNAMLPRSTLAMVAILVLGFSAATAVAAAVLRGLARLLEHGGGMGGG